MKKIYKLLLTLILSVISLFTTFVPAVATASAESETKYSSVMDDLTKDSSFNTGNYPSITNPLNADGTENEKYGTIEVIHIAEGSSKELFIYAYQPADEVLDLVAVKISMWDEYYDGYRSFTPIIYDLELVSTSGVFDKYLVKGYTVSDEADRYYYIPEIFRAYNETLDGALVAGALADIISIRVAQQWHAEWFNDKLTYNMDALKVVEITKTFVGSLNLHNGITAEYLAGVNSAVDLWYFSFNVEDYIVEHIYDADVFFEYRTVSHKTGGISAEDTYTMSDWIPKTKYLSAESEGVFEGEGLFGRTVKWKEIMLTKTFVDDLEDQDISFDSEIKEDMLKGQWTFAYHQTKNETYSISGFVPTYYHDYTLVQNVGIVRLYFRDNRGHRYNLGAIDNLTTPDNIADGSGGTKKLFDFLDDWFEKLIEFLTMILGTIILVIFINPIMTLLGILLKVFKVILDFVLWLISAPFKLLGLLFGRNKRR